MRVEDLHRYFTALYAQAIKATDSGSISSGGRHYGDDNSAKFRFAALRGFVFQTNLFPQLTLQRRRHSVARRYRHVYRLPRGKVQEEPLRGSLIAEADARRRHMTRRCFARPLRVSWSTPICNDTVRHGGDAGFHVDCQR